MPRSTVHAARVQEHGAEAEVVDAAADLVDGGVDVVGREETGAEQARRVLVGRSRAASRCTRADRGGELRLVARRRPTAPRCRARARTARGSGTGPRSRGPPRPWPSSCELRVPAARFGSGERGVLLRHPPDRVARFGRTGPIRVRRVVLHPDPHVAVQLGEPDGRRVAPRRVDVALPEVGRLHHVHVAVGNLPVRPHDPPSATRGQSTWPVRQYGAPAAATGAVGTRGRREATALVDRRGSVVLAVAMTAGPAVGQSGGSGSNGNLDRDRRRHHARPRSASASSPTPAARSRRACSRARSTACRRGPST